MSAEQLAEQDVTADADAFADWLYAHCLDVTSASVSQPITRSLSIAQLCVVARQDWRASSVRIAAMDELQRRYMASQEARIVRLTQQYERETA